MYISTEMAVRLSDRTVFHDPADELFAITGRPPTVPDQTRDFLRLLYDPTDILLLRWIESYTDPGPHTRLARQVGTWHIPANDLTAEHPPLDPRYCRWAALSWLAERERANVYVGVCPRLRGRVERRNDRVLTSFSWDLAGQIRTVRVLWADLDGCLPVEALQRCDAAGLPRPSAVVASGHGTHLYWRLLDPVVIDTTPIAWVTEHADGKKKEYGIDPSGMRSTGKPPLVPDAVQVQQTLNGILAAIGGDAGTSDLSRCLRLPGTMNRKNQRYGAEPIPCELVEIDPARQYPFEEFARFRVASQDKARTSHRPAPRVELPMAYADVPGENDLWPQELNTLVEASPDADDRSKAEFRVCCRAIELGVAPEAVWRRMQSVGKMAERGRPYFDRTWRSAVSHVSRQAHSRRLDEPAHTDAEPARITLDQARSDLHAHLERELSRDPVPGRFNLIRVPPGVGKSHSACELIGRMGKKAIVLTLEKKLSATHADRIVEHGGRAMRLPVLRESPCPHPDAYEAMSRRGFQPSQAYPCKTCKIGPKRCSYLISFSSLPDADQLCGPAIYHTHDGFYSAHGNDTRSVVILDESFVDILLEPVSNSLEDWVGWGSLVPPMGRRGSRRHGRH